MNKLNAFRQTVDALGNEFDSHDFIRKLIEKHHVLYAVFLIRHRNVNTAHAEIARYLGKKATTLKIHGSGERKSEDIFGNETSCTLWKK